MARAIVAALFLAVAAGAASAQGPALVPVK